MQLLGVSVLTYQGAPKSIVRTMSHPVETTAPLLALWLPMLATFTPIHAFATVVILTFFLLPSHYAAAFWIGSLTVYYLLTGFGAPEHTGKTRPSSLKCARVGLGVAQGMLGHPSRPDRLACMGLDSHVIIPLRAIRRGIWPK